MNISRAFLGSVLALACVSPVAAQTAPAAGEQAPRAEAPVAWEPLGAIPVDQAGAGLRGYVLPAESADVTPPGANRFSIQAVAANDFYREQSGDYLISERYEAHTLALGYRRGFDTGVFPRLEIGARVQLHESDDGFLNGFISGVEDLSASLTGREAAKNQLRANPAALPLGTIVTSKGRPLFQALGDSSGFGDVYVVVNALLVDAPSSSPSPRVAARIAVNIAGAQAFTEGNFAGIGLSVDEKVASWAALHGDVRTQLMLDRVSPWGLPLNHASIAFSAGPELRLGAQGSISFQYDGATTPYEPAGAAAFDENYGDLTIGISRRFKVGGRFVVGQIYGRENIDLPLRVRWNTDPDFALGIKATIE